MGVPRDRENRASVPNRAIPAAPAVGPKQRSFISFGFNQLGASSSSSPARPTVNVNVEGSPAQGADTPEIRKYKKRFVISL